MTEIAKIDETTPVDAIESATEVVDAAVSWLNRTSQVSGIRLAVEVSSYILTTFFDGDFKQFSSHDRTKPSSFSALCRREDLNLGESTLYRLVRIGHQVQLLPTAVAESLSLTHHRVLLAVDDPRQKQRIAKAAVNENWTVEQLEAETRKLRPKDATKAGRPPIGRANASAMPGIELPQPGHDGRSPRWHVGIGAHCPTICGPEQQAGRRIVDRVVIDVQSVYVDGHFGTIGH